MTRARRPSGLRALPFDRARASSAVHAPRSSARRPSRISLMAPAPRVCYERRITRTGLSTVTKVVDAVDQADLPFWKRSHYLDRMTLRQLVVAYFQHYTIMTYLAPDARCASSSSRCARPAVADARRRSRRAWRSTRSSGTCCTSTCCIRGGCGNRSCSRRPGSASTTITTRIPTISRCCSARSTPRCRRSRSATLPIGWAIGGIGGAAAAFATGLRDHLLLRVHALHPAPRVQAEVDVGAAHEAAPHGAPFLRRERQLRHHQLSSGTGPRHLLREEGPPEALARRCSTSATTRTWPRSIRG